MSEGRGLSALRVGIAAGAGIGAALVLISLRGVPSDGFVWFIVALSRAAGGYLGWPRIPKNDVPLVERGRRRYHIAGYLR